MPCELQRSTQPSLGLGTDSLSACRHGANGPKPEKVQGCAACLVTSSATGRVPKD